MLLTLLKIYVLIILVLSIVLFTIWLIKEERKFKD
jgi:hypothetical protein